MTPTSFRGTVQAAAFLLDETLVSHPELVRRTLALWAPGTKLRRTRMGWVVTLARSRRVAVDAAPGLPLVARKEALVGFAAEEPLLAQLAPPAGALVLLQAGQPLVIADGEEASAADWLDLGTVEVVATRGLVPPTPPTLAPPPTRSVHEALGPAVPAPAEARQRVLRQAAGQAPLEDERTSFTDWLGGLADRVGGLFGLHKLLGQKHGRYLAELIQMLERGETKEGLRHAIPLTSVQDLARRHAARMPWRRPRARDTLDISPTRIVPSSRLTLDDDLFTQLRKLYRHTFETLDAQGRHEEAAFVLAELLHEDEEAVAYLEGHGQLRRAAELAEARRCAPGLVVRAWFLAGDQRRAVRLARERGAFRDAIVRLERGRPNEAKALRLLWADALASAGDYAGAVQAIQAFAEAAPLLERWLEAGIALGEAQAVRLIPLAAALLPERWAQTRAQADEWMAGGAESFHRRRMLAEALLSVPPNERVRLLARRCVRACLTQLEGPALDATTLEALVRLTGDGALLIDLPSAAYRPPARVRSSGAPLVATLEGGSAAFRDGAVLPSGRLLVAQGDAGAMLLGPGGALLHHFDVPADRLVIADAGDRAIALSERGGSMQLARLDLGNRRARPWDLTRIDRFADSYDGNSWFITAGSRVLALDALAEQPRCFWSVDLDDEDSRPTLLVRSANELIFVAASWALESWHYELPSLTLKRRKPLDAIAAPGPVLGFWPSREGTAFAAALDLEAKQFVVISPGVNRREVRFPIDPEAGALVCEGTAANGLLALTLSDPLGLKVRLFDEALTVTAEVTLPGATRATVRLRDHHLIVVRHDGPLLAIDLDCGTFRTVTR